MRFYDFNGNRTNTTEDVTYILTEETDSYETDGDIFFEDTNLCELIGGIDDVLRNMKHSINILYRINWQEKCIERFGDDFQASFNIKEDLKNVCCI